MRAVALAILTTLAACGQGTAPAAPPPSGPQYENPQAIVDRLPLIDACLALAPDRRTVTINPASDITLRLSGEAGDLDCAVPDDDPDPSRATVLPALNDLPEDAIIFVRAPKGVKVDDIWAPYYLEGTFGTGEFLNDTGDAAYSIDLTKLEPYPYP